MAVQALYDERQLAAAAVPQNQLNVVIDGGAGNDTIAGSLTGINHIFGGEGNDKLYGGGFTSRLEGGAGDDVLHNGGFGSRMWGGAGADIFEIGGNTHVMDATTADFAMWGPLYLSGGIQLPWQEGAWYHWQPFSSLVSVWGFASLVGGAFDTTFAFVADRVLGSVVRYSVTTSGQLIVQLGSGRGGQAIIDGYKYDAETAKGTAGISVFGIEMVRDGSLGDILHYINAALKAGFGACLPGYDPLVIDLDRDGLELTREARGVYFDSDQDGFAEKTAWVAPDDGLLARDLNGNGLIDHQGELFGNAITGGFTALASLDGNSDNRITAADPGFSSLRVWRDLDQDGVTDTGELQTLSRPGIARAALRAFSGDRSPRFGHMDTVAAGCQASMALARHHQSKLGVARLARTGSVSKWSKTATGGYHLAA